MVGGTPEQETQLSDMEADAAGKLDLGEDPKGNRLRLLFFPRPKRRRIASLEKQVRGSSR